MKWFLILWAGPIALLGSWYGLSYYDMSFGFFMLTRDAHDLVFQIYGHILGIPPEDLPPLVLRAIIVDSFLVLGLIAFRRRKKILAWWQARRQSASDALANDESLSSAP
jgi:putative exporter of polyketide antibiotics